MKKLSIKNIVMLCFAILVRGNLPQWWWGNLSDKFYESKKLHDYKDGKIDYRFISDWFLSK